MWDKTFIHLVWVPCSEKASPSSHSSKSAQLMKIALSGGWTASLWTHNGNEERRDRGGAAYWGRQKWRVCVSVCVSLEQFELVTQLYPWLLPLLKTPLPCPLKALFPHALRDSAKLCLLPLGFSQAARKTKGFQSRPQTQWIPALLSLQYPAFQK